MDILNRHGWIFLLAAMIGDIAFSFIFAMFYKEYSIMKMSISALGNPNSPVRIPFNIWMITEGILFLAATPAIYERYAPVSGGLTKIMTVFIAAFAVGACIFTGFFSVNETKDVVTTASKVHGVGSAVGFMLFLFVPLLVAILSIKNGETAIGMIGIVCFVISLIFFVLFVMADKPEFNGTMIQYEGLWQRLNLIFMYLPLIIISIRYSLNRSI